MKKYTAIILGTCMLCTNLAFSQLSPYHSYQQLYDEALELFNKELYGSAIRKVESFLAEERGYRGNIHNDVHANAKFIQAVSAYHLERQDALDLLDAFSRQHFENTKADLTKYYLSKHYFDRKEYEAAIEPLLACYSSVGLQEDKYNEVIFMLGYSYFVDVNNKKTDDSKAERYLGLAANSNSEWREDASYYFAILLYRQGDYDRAYTNLKSLENSEKYADELRVYLANTLMKLKKYDELFILADGLERDRGNAKNADVFAIVANASYERNDYRKATEYFKEFEESGRRLNRTSSFRYAYSQYKLGRFGEAIPIFEQVLTPTDSLSQVASYFLGFCFLREDDPDGARHAFEIASRIDDGPVNFEIAEDAKYQYAKVSFATAFYDEARDALEELMNPNLFPRFKYREEAQEMIGEILYYSKNYPESIEFFESSPITTRRAREAYQSACYYYGLDLIRNKNYGEADIYLQKATKISADRDMALSAQFWFGESRFKQENYPGARSAFTSYNKMAGSGANRYSYLVNYNIGWTYFKEKRYDQALASFDRFLRSSGAQKNKRPLVDAYLRAGDCLFLKKKYAQAKSYYQKVIDANAGYQDMAYFQIGEGEYRNRRYQSSVSSFAQIVRSRKSDLRDDALDRISEIYLTWIKDYRQAERNAELLVRDYPKGPFAAGGFNRLGLAAINLGDERGAVNNFKRVLSDYPNDRNNSQVALDNLSSLLSANEFDRILRDYRNSNPKMDDNLAELTFRTGMDRFFAENYNSAIGQFSTYVRDFKNGPNFYEALLYRARSYKAVKKEREALRDYKSIYDSSSFNEFTSVALKEAGTIYFDGKNYPKSLELYQKMEETASNLGEKVEAKFGIANSYFALEDYQRAKGPLNEISGNPEVEEFSRTKARVLTGEAEYELGELSKASQTFVAIEREFNDEHAAQSQYMITRILFDQKKYDDAYEAGVYMKNNYPSYNYWKALTFLVVAEANYELGEVFQAKGTLQSLVDQTKGRYPDVYQMAKQRLEEIEAEERRNQGGTPGNE